MKNKLIQARKKFRKFFYRYVNGTKGVISILLMLLMLPFMSIAGILINAARINSAVAVFDEALCNASDSTLGTYDEFLRSRFGLLAISQDGKGAHGAGYTQTQFIQDLFQEYMDENMKSLNSTYDTNTLTATGILPLGNVDVLKTSVYEASKYSVPVRFVMDGLYIEDLIKKITEPLSVVGSMFNVITDGAGTANAADDVQDAITALKDAVADMEEKITAYNTAYNEFIVSYVEGGTTKDGAVIAYNKEVDRVKAAILAAQNAASQAETTYNSKVTAVNNAINSVGSALVNEYESKKNDSEKLAEFMTAHGDDIKPYTDAVSARDSAYDTWQEKKGDLDDAIEDAEKTLGPLRTTLTTKRNNYKQATDDLAESTKAAGEALVDFRDKAKAFIDQLNQTHADMLTYGCEVINTSYDSNKKTLEQQLKDEKAKTPKDTNKIAELELQIQDINDHKADYSNTDTVVSTALDNSNDATAELEKLTQDSIKLAFDSVYGKLVTLKDELNNTAIPTDTVTKYPETSIVQDRATADKPVGDHDWYITPITEINSKNIQDVIDKLQQDVQQDSGWKFIKAVVGFLTALLTASLPFDPELCNTISFSEFKDYPTAHMIGDFVTGNWSNPKNHDACNPYEDEDKAKYLEYKDLLSSYGDEDEPVEDFRTIGDVIMDIYDQIMKIGNAIDTMSWTNFFTKLGEIISAIVRIAELLWELVTMMATFTFDAVKTKLLVTGYLGYNLCNRTTKGGKALTGADYDLPSSSGSYSNLAFAGAELEYILVGTPIEIANQTAAWFQMYMLRILFDLPFVFTDTEVQGYADAAGACSWGIGYAAVILIYIFCEPLVDMVVLCGGNSVPIIKKPLYLTIEGIPSLISAVTSISLNSQQTGEVRHAFRTGVKSQFGITEEQVSKIGANQVKNPQALKGAAGWWGDLLTVDYTKLLMLLILIELPNEIMLTRFGDIVQMEGTYHYANQIGSYDFNIYEAYTFLRVSGEFETNEFMRMASTDVEYSYQYGDAPQKSIADRIFKSDARILYRGY